MKGRSQKDTSQPEPTFATKEEADKMRSTVQLWRSIKGNSGNFNGKNEKNGRGRQTWSKNRYQVSDASEPSDEATAAAAAAAVVARTAKQQKRLELETEQRAESQRKREAIAEQKRLGIESRAQKRLAIKQAKAQVAVVADVVEIPVVDQAS